MIDLSTAKGMTFSTSMVRALIDGTKTQTRMVIMPQPKTCDDFTICPDGGHGICGCDRGDLCHLALPKSPYQPGGIIYVRETWAPAPDIEGDGPRYLYKADTTVGGAILLQDGDAKIAYIPSEWRPSIFMPKAAARIILRITDVKAERLQDIRIRDSISEGVNTKSLHVYAFSLLWDSIHAKRKGGIYAWKRNPWVFAYGLELLEVRK